MAEQEGGWPLGLQPLNVRMGLIRNLDFSGSLSFNTLITGSSSSSSVTSSDLDTESTGSFFHDRSITLGSLIGITNILELSSRSLRSRRQDTVKGKKSHKSRTWFSLCAKTQLNTETSGNAQSLGHFLDIERRSSNVYGRNRVPVTYELDGLPESQSTSEPISLFSNGFIAPPQVHGDGCLALVGDVKKPNTLVGGLPLLFPCMGGQSSH